MIAAVICFASKNKSLQSVRTVLTDPEKMREAIEKMCESGDVWDGMLGRFGHQLRQFRDKELGSVLTTTNRFLRFLDSVAIADNTRTSTFYPAEKYHQDYFANNPFQPYCQAVVSPKVEKVRKVFKDLLK